MKKPNIIVFDVDNTLIKGNLTFFFFWLLAKERVYFFRKCIVLFASGALLTITQLPQIAKRILSNDGNVYKLDHQIYSTIKQFYKKLFKLFNELNLLNENLQKKANSLFSEKFLSKKIYPEAIQKMKHHLQNKNNIVVLISGSAQEIVNPLFTMLCKQLYEANIPWENRFFALGTHLGTNTTDIRPCIGSKKNILLKELLQQQGYNEYVLRFIYSDNNFMADLPLLIEAKNGGVLVCNKSSLYKTLPKKLVQSFIFLPSWKKATYKI